MFLVLVYGLAQIYFSTTEIPPTQYYCPAMEERIPLNEYGESGIVWEDGDSSYGFQCTVCGSVHVYNLGIAPFPVYQGDRIKLKLTAEGLVQSELDKN